MTKIVRILFRVNTIYVVNSYHIYLTSCQNNISFESLHIICNQTTCRTEYLTMIESLHFVQSHFLVTYTFQDSFQQRIFFISCRHLQMLVPRNQHKLFPYEPYLPEHTHQPPEYRQANRVPYE